MTSPYKPDRTFSTSQAYRYYSYGKLRYRIPISGSIPNNTLRRWQIVIVFTDSRFNVRAFLSRSDTGMTVPMYVGWRLPSITGSYEVYQKAGGEVVEANIHYEDNGETFVGNFFISNTTGSSINLIDQTLDMWLEIYEAPVTWF